MEAQRYGFQMELEKVREELHRVESRSTTLEHEMNTLKGQKQTSEQRPTQDTLATKNAPTIPQYETNQRKGTERPSVQKLRSNGRVRLA